MPLKWTWARFDDLGVHALHDALALRCKVFILEQGPYQDPDGADKQSHHLLGYDGAPLPLQNPALILINRMKVEGFIVSEHMEVWPDALKELGTLVGTGKLRPRETIAQGIAAAPEAFLGLLKGKNFGKQLVKLV